MRNLLLFSFVLFFIVLATHANAGDLCEEYSEYGCEVEQTTINNFLNGHGISRKSVAEHASLAAVMDYAGIPAGKRFSITSQWAAIGFGDGAWGGTASVRAHENINLFIGGGLGVYSRRGAAKAGLQLSW